MRENNINFELQGKVRKYLEHLMTKESNSEKEQEIFSKLTHSLKKELMLNSNGKLLSQIPFFTNNFCEETVEDLSFCLQKIRYSPEEYLYKLNETDDGSLFLIESGSLESVVNGQQGVKHLKEFKKGDILGLFSFFTDEPRNTSVRSKDFSTVFEIKKEEFLNILKKYPTDYEQYVMIRDKIKLYNQEEDLKINCQCCEKKTHTFFKCPLIHYIPDADFLIKRLNYSTPQTRQTSTYSRKKMKFNALGDHLLILNKIGKIQSIFFSDDESQSGFDDEELNFKKQEASSSVIPSIKLSEKEKGLNIPNNL